MTKMRNRVPRFGLLCVALAGAAALALTAGTARSASGGGTITMRTLLDPGNLDPHKAASGAAQAFALYDYDTALGNIDGKIVPQLATKWRVTPSSATLVLRNDVTCADGTKLRASDVAASYDRLKDPTTKSPYVSTWMGSTAYVVTSNDAKSSVHIQLPKPYGPLVYGLAAAPVICKAGLQDPAKLATQTFGTGPFVLSQAVPGDHYTLTKRKGYKWGPNGATNADGPDQLVLKVVDNETTATNLLLTGGLDIANVIGPERQRLERDGSLFKTELNGEVFSIFFNHRKGHPTSDPAVRRALAMAVNRKDLAVAINGEFGKTATSILLPQAPCQDKTMEQAITPFDRKRSARTFAADGWRTSGGKLQKRGKQLTLNLLIPDLITGASDYLIDAWKKSGIDVESEVRPATQVVSTLFGRGNWDVTIVGVGATLPSNYLAFLSSPPPPGGANFMAVTNAKYNQTAAAAATKVVNTACKQWSEAERYVHQQVDLLPVTFNVTGWYGKGVTFDPWSQAGIRPTSIKRS